jgi:hypothetical protein
VIQVRWISRSHGLQRLTRECVSSGATRPQGRTALQTGAVARSAVPASTSTRRIFNVVVRAPLHIFSAGRNSDPMGSFAACPVGRYSPVAIDDACLPCSPGRYINGTGATKCSACAAGTVLRCGRGDFPPARVCVCVCVCVARHVCGAERVVGVHGLRCGEIPIVHRPKLMHRLSSKQVSGRPEPSDSSPSSRSATVSWPSGPSGTDAVLALCRAG